ncbi:hypothetical protein [Nostoc sp.]
MASTTLADSTRPHGRLVEVQTIYKSCPPQRVVPIPPQQVGEE